MEEKKALLGYMIHHNEHHEEELSGYAQVAAGRSKVLIEEAISLFKEGNDKLKQALALMEEE